MKRFALFAVLVAGMLLPSLAAAQSEHTYDHGEVGVFADYMRLTAPDPSINFIGVGGRVAFNVHPNIALEGEMAYDFERNTTSVFDNGVTTSFATTRLRPLTALFGPKFQAGTSGPFRAFVTGKVGFVNFANTSNLSTNAFGNQIGGITDGDTKFAVYPGAGIEAFAGPIGFRLEVGDEIYFSGGAQNNLKVSFGPHFRF
jgi:opacity protein-like surface antigen